jgi:GTP-binding protein HflX
MTCVIPYDKGMLANMVHERCQVMREQYTQEGLLVTIKADAHMAGFLEPYKTDDEGLFSE